MRVRRNHPRPGYKPADWHLEIGPLEVAWARRRRALHHRLDDAKHSRLPWRRRWRRRTLARIADEKPWLHQAHTTDGSGLP